MRKIFAALAVIICCTLNPAWAAGSDAALDFGTFKTLPVLHEGRIKPLDSFARIYLRRLCDCSAIAGLSPAQWLAETVFNPSSAIELNVLSIKNNKLKEILGLPADQTHFSLPGLQQGLQDTAPQLESLLAADPQTLTRDQQDLLTLHENALSLMQLLRALSLVLPLDIDLPRRYSGLVKNGDLTYQALAKIEPRLNADVKKLVQQKGSDPAQYTDEEKRIAALGFQMLLLRSGSQTSALLRIVPVSWDDAGENWVSPWSLLQDGYGSPESADYLAYWKQMAQAYREGDTAGWNAATTGAFKHIRTHGGDGVSPPRLRAETLYNTAGFFTFAMLAYAACFIILAITARRTAPRLAGFAKLLLAGGLVMQGLGIACRIYVLARPPVGTLYESVLFVSLIAAAGALLGAWRQKSDIPALAGSVTAAILLLVAPSLLPRGESMEMLVAVLNTGFWLGTHVVCITAGYGVCILAAGLAHFYMAGRLAGLERARLESLQHNIYRASLAALLLTAVGTALGGIWADQSWGRFWGWDPKENGALLIVLWLIWAQHGRQAGHLDPLRFAAAIAALNIVVALAWFGVNLLSTGLHSYGFISGIAWGLGLFCGAEMLLIAALWGGVRIREERKHAAAHIV